MNIAQRLTALILGAGAALLIVGGNAVYQSMHVDSRVTFMADVVISDIAQGARLKNDFKEEQLETFAYLIEDDPVKRNQMVAAIAATRARINEKLKQYAAFFANDKDKANYETLKDKLEDLAVTHSRVVALAHQGDIAGARHLMNTEGDTVGAAAAQAMDTLMDYNLSLSNSEIDEIQAMQRVAIQTSSLMLVAGLILLSIGGFFLVRSIRRPLHEMHETMDTISSSLDLTLRVKTGDDEIGGAMTAFNSLLDRIQASLFEVREKIEAVSDAAGEMSQTADELSRTAGVTSEAASAMAATVEQVTVSINHVSERASEADSLSRESGDQAASGGSVIERTVGEIDGVSAEVRESADKISALQALTASIGAVVNTIKEIADQTNLLALNAAIEAARAGEQGRGFAVVADEVRKLAERTTVSTHEIANTILAVQGSADEAVAKMQETVRRVETSVAAAREAGEAIRGIRGGSTEVVARVADISSSIREQGVASNSMAQAVERVAQMSEENSSAASQTAQCSAALQQLAADMQLAIRRYRI